MSATWPGAISSSANLFTAVNLLTTTLSVSMTSSTPSTITVASTTGFPTVGAVTIDNEVIYYTGVSGSTLTGLTRGADGTTAAAHNSGVPVGATVIANHINALTAEVIAVETSLDFAHSFAMTSNSSGRLAVSAVTATELGYLSGVTSAVQTQLDAKATDTSVVHLTGAELITGAKTFLSSDLKIRESGGGTNVITISASPLAIANTYNLPDAGNAANFVLTQGTQTIAGSTTFSSTSGNPIHGISTNSQPSSGYVGEVLQSTITIDTSVGSNGVVFDATSLSLTAGNWIIYAAIDYQRNSATFTSTNIESGVSTTTGNSVTGLLRSQNYFLAIGVLPTSFDTFTMTAAHGWPVSISTTTVYYLKAYLDTYTAGTPKYRCSIFAVRTS